LIDQLKKVFDFILIALEESTPYKGLAKTYPGIPFKSPIVLEKLNLKTIKKDH
jgi:hypothetical protein